MYACRAKRELLDYSACLLGGLLAALGLPGLLSPVLVLPGIWLLLLSVEGKGAKRAAQMGFLWGTVHFGVMIWWIAPTISLYGRLPLWAAIPIVGLLALYLACYPALWAYLFKGLPVERGVARAFWGAALWGATEWLRGTILTGFPWGVIALSLSSHPLFIQSADLFGIYGVGALYFLWLSLGYGVVFQLVTGKSLDAAKAALVLVAVSGLVVAYGADRLKRFSETMEEGQRGGDAICAVSVQGSIPQRLKWDPALKEKTLERYFDLTQKGLSHCKEQARWRLSIWPETAVTTYIQDDLETLFRLSEFSRENGTYLIFGAPTYEFKDKDGGKGRPSFFNSAYLLAPDGTLKARYDKRHLVPFGEYMPLGPFSDMARTYLPTAGDFVAGERGGVLDSGQGLKVGMLVCFESIFPDLARDSVVEGANVLAVITNDAWFGKTQAPFQHEAMSVFRAVEERRWLIRSANTGVSSIIAPTGERVRKTDIFVPKVVSHTIKTMTYRSPYNAYGEYGFCAFILLISSVALGAVLLKRY